MFLSKRTFEYVGVTFVSFFLFCRKLVILIGPNVGDAVKACFSIFIESLQFPFEVIKRSREDEASLNSALGIAGVHIENQFDMIARVLDFKYIFISRRNV